MNQNIIWGLFSNFQIFKFSNYSYLYPNPNLNPEKFIEVLLAIISRYKPKILIPVHEKTFIIAKYRELFPKDLIIPICDYDKLITAHDKISSTQIAKSLGVPTPKILLFDEAINSTIYPIV